MSRLTRIGLHIGIAYPGTLGPAIPDPPFGFAYLVDDNGVYLTDDSGVYLLVELNG